MGNRVPSFYTSPSLVNLSGLAVGDQPLLTGNGSAMKKSNTDGSFGDGAPTMDSGSEDGRSQGDNSSHAAPGSPMSSSSAPPRSGEDGYVKSTSMAAFYYRRNKSNDSLKI